MPSLALPCGPSARERLLRPIALAVAVTSATLGTPPATFAWDAGEYGPQSEAELAVLTNQARASAHLPTLRADPALGAIARGRSRDMVERSYFSHQIPPDGRSVFDVMTDDAYCFTLAGENIGWNNYPDDQSTAAIQRMFMDSPSHRDNVLGERWEVVGVGAFKASDGRKMWTVLFADACRTDAPAPPASRPVSELPTSGRAPLPARSADGATAPPRSTGAEPGPAAGSHDPVERLRVVEGPPGPGFAASLVADIAARYLGG